MSSFMFSILLLAGFVALFAAIISGVSLSSIAWTATKVICKSRWLWLIDLLVTYQSWSQKRAIYRKTRCQQRKRKRKREKETEAYRRTLVREHAELDKALVWLARDNERMKRRKFNIAAKNQRKSLKADAKARIVTAKEERKAAKLAVAEIKKAKRLAEKRMRIEEAFARAEDLHPISMSDMPRKRPKGPPRPRPKPKARLAEPTKITDGTRVKVLSADSEKYAGRIGTIQEKKMPCDCCLWVKFEDGDCSVHFVSKKNLVAEVL